MLNLPSPAMPSSRRRRTRAEKVQIVKESLAPNVSIASVALNHRINANQLHKWRWQYRQGKLGNSEQTALLLPVQLTKPAQFESVPVGQKHSATEPGYVEILVGETCVRIHGVVVSQALRVVLEVLSS